MHTEKKENNINHFTQYGEKYGESVENYNQKYDLNEIQSNNNLSSDVQNTNEDNVKNNNYDTAKFCTIKSIKSKKQEVYFVDNQENIMTEPIENIESDVNNFYPEIQFLKTLKPYHLLQCLIMIY